jgi:hypothetical protein
VDAGAGVDKNCDRALLRTDGLRQNITLTRGRIHCESNNRTAHSPVGGCSGGTIEFGGIAVEITRLSDVDDVLRGIDGDRLGRSPGARDLNRRLRK